MRHNTESTEERAGTSLDLLENEDRRVLAMSEEMDDSTGTQVLDSADYGNRAKLLVRRLAVREAALVDVAEGLCSVPELSELGTRFLADIDERRRRYDRVERMSRGVQGIYLNLGQDFDAALSSLLELVRGELEWDLSDGIPTVRRVLDETRCGELFHSPHHVERHAPTHLRPGGRAWWERWPLISRLATAVTHLRDYPRSTPDART